VAENERAVEGHKGSEPPRPFPSGVIAFTLAVLAAVGFVVEGYLVIRGGGGRQGCDGGTCVVALYLGILKGVVALVVGFPLLWVLISVVSRLFRRRDARTIQ
jgi:hypothetical protein